MISPATGERVFEVTTEMTNFVQHLYQHFYKDLYTIGALRSATRSIRFGVVSVGCTLLLGCKLTTGGCPDPAAIPVHINVVENVTGARLTRNATAVLTGLVSVDTTLVLNGSANFLIPPEREGAYGLKITSFGYDDWERNNLTIAHAAACTRNATVDIDARLTITAASAIASQ